MPIYEYKCPSCGHRFEVLRKISDDPDGKCPHCEAQAKRLFHPVGVIFKGSGFYTTDYGRQNSLPGSGKESSSKETKSASDGKPGGSEAKSSPAKPESKTGGD